VDRIREKPASKFNKKHLAIGAGVAALLVVLSSVASIDFSSKRIKRNSLLIGEVKKGQLDIKVSANGVLLPREVEWLASQVEGRVRKMHVKPGDSVKAGQVLVELDNPLLHVAEQEAISVLEGSKATLEAFKADLDNRLMEQEAVTLRTKFSLDKSMLQHKAEETLLKDGIVSELDYQRTKLDVEQFTEVLELEKQRLERFKNNMSIELAAEEAKVVQAQQSLERARNSVKALTVTSGINGIVQAMDLEIGQRLQPGGEIGRIAQQDLLYAELKVQARQASKIVQGQKALIDTRNGEVEGKVRRVEPAVNEGTVIVDVDLVGKLPAGARPELQVEGIIFQEQFSNTLFVAKPNLVKTNSTVSLYRLDEDGDYAERISVKLGEASVDRVQVLSGLQELDRIILSDSSSWQEHDVILLN